MMMVRLGCLISILLLCATRVGADAPLSPAAQLIKDVVYNEAHDRLRHGLWTYHVEKRTAGQTFSEQQVETTAGPLFRVLAINGTPLNREQRKQDDDRINQILEDKNLANRMRQQHEEEEKRLEYMVQLLPDEYIYDLDGNDGPNIRLKFRPNPGYNPSTYEARALHALAGTVLVNRDQKRLASIQATLITSVQYGFGLFGHLDQGGTMLLKREMVMSGRWKSTVIDVHVSGRIILFKSLNRDQDEVRSGFRMLPDGTTLQDAKRLLYQ